jgi:ABC-type phosphate transport system substrate-binding protein
MFNQNRALHIYFVVTSLLLPISSFAEVLVVTAANSPLMALSSNQICDLFTGKSAQLSGGTPVILIDQTELNPLREEFYFKVAHKSAAQIKANWAKLYFTGRGIPPREANNSEHVKKMVATIPGAIGYIERPSLDDSVKIIFDAQ